MAINRTTTDFIQRTDIIDSVTPNCVKQDEIRAPAGEFKPAPWLPVQFTKHNRDAGTDAFVISKGKVVAFDSQGRIVPAGLRTALGGNGSTSVFAGTVLSYTADDVTWKVENLVTGVACTAAVSYTGEQVADAIISRGLVRRADVIATAGGAVPVTTDAHVNIVIDLFISKPVGVSALDVYVWSGQLESGDQKFTNYSKQHLVSYLTEVQLMVPQRVAGSTSSDAFVTGSLSTESFAAGDAIAAGEYWNAANVSQLKRYSTSLTSASPVAAIGLAQQFVAVNTDRTPFTCDTADVLIRERRSAAEVTRAGDWFLDAEVGVLFLSSTTWAALAGAATTITFTYDYYTDTGLAGAHKFIHFDGPCRAGDFVTVDAQSNLTAILPTTVTHLTNVVGRVTGVEVQPRSLMQHVKTAWNLTNVSKVNQMPGSATKGFTDLITLSDETVADRVVVVNIRV